MFLTFGREPHMRGHLQELDRSKPVVYCGDLNVAHLDADIYNYDAKHIVKQSGCTPQERAAFGEMLSCGFVDAFRHLYPGKVFHR
jgi:exonuclease III